MSIYLYDFKRNLTIYLYETILDSPSPSALYSFRFFLFAPLLLRGSSPCLRIILPLGIDVLGRHKPVVYRGRQLRTASADPSICSRKIRDSRIVWINSVCCLPTSLQTRLLLHNDITGGCCKPPQLSSLLPDFKYL